MIGCWNINREERPAFSVLYDDIVATEKELCQVQNGYEIPEILPSEHFQIIPVIQQPTFTSDVRYQRK